MKPIFRWW